METLLSIRVKPGAKRDDLGIDDAGGPVVSVRARAVDGQANEAVRRFLATCLNIAPSAITLRNGANSRHKRFSVTGLSYDEAMARLRAKLLG